MIKKFVSVILILVLVLSSCMVAFAENANSIVTPQANMVTYHTLSPIVGKSTDYISTNETYKGNMALESAIISLGASAITLAISKNASLSKYVKAAVDAATIGSGIYATYKAAGLQYATGLFYTTRVYKYKSNGPHTYAFKYITTFYADSSRTTSVYQTVEYYTYVI